MKNMAKKIKVGKSSLRSSILQVCNISYSLLVVGDGAPQNPDEDCLSYYMLGGTGHSRHLVGL